MQNKPQTFSFLTKVIIATLFVAGATSCTSPKNLYYFRDLPDSSVITLPPITSEERVIEKGDRLDIAITGKDQEAAGFFNRSRGATGGGVGNEPGGYLVDNNGYLEFPIIGKVRVVGLTSAQLKENLTKQVTPYLKEPLVDVQFTTFKISVLGEVRRPGTLDMSMQRTTLLEALAAAGDLPNSAKRYNIHLYRDYNGQRKIMKIDLRKKSVLTDPNIFQIKHNDVLYVQARPGSFVREDFGLFTSMVTLLVGVVTLGLTIQNR